MTNQKLYLIITIVILFILIFKNQPLNKYNNGFYYKKGIEQGKIIGKKTTIRYLYLDGYLPDTLHIDTILYNDIEKFYIKKINN